MQIVRLPVLVLTISLLFGAGAALYAQDHSKDTTHAQQLQWWKAQRFGLFIHWGPVSIKGEEISWSRGNQIPTNVYDTLYKLFNPTGFNAGQWVKIAQDAGMRYMVFVTKHHDGFCEFNSALTNYKITSPQCPFRRDVTKELADSCHKAGLGFGVYYSPTDWYVGNNGSAAYLTYYTNQVVDELLSNYGRIEVVWWDLAAIGADPTTLLNRMRQKQPWVLVDNRGDNSTVGWDFKTPEQVFGSFDTLTPWESCMTIDGANQWAWNPDGGVKPLKQLIGMVVGCADGGGNCLLNVGPRPDGIIDPPMVSRLQQIGAWMQKYGESIYGTVGGPIVGGSWGGTTHKGDTMYVHLAPWSGTVTIPPVNATIVSSTCLTGGTPTIVQRSGSISISLPAQNIDSIFTIIKMVLDYSKPLFHYKNVALGKTATQSSTGYGGTADRAVDGNIDGVFNDNSVTHTNSQAGAWWMVNLGSAFTISSIEIYNRTDGYMDRLSDFTVTILDRSQNVVWSNHQTTYPNPVTQIDVGGINGQYVRIQLTGTNYLSLAEVKVNVDTLPPAGIKQEMVTRTFHPSGTSIHRVMGKVTLDKSFSGNEKSIAVYDLGGHLLKQGFVKKSAIDLRKDFGIAAEGIYIIRVKTQ